MGPAGTSTGSNWPFTLVTDPPSGRLTFVWNSDVGQGPRVEYREVSLKGLWDASSHVLAGPDSGGAVQPLAVQDPLGNLVTLWLQAGTVHSRTRRGNAPIGSPPQIIPLAGAPQYLGQSHPNPMSPHAVIPFQVPAAVAHWPSARGAEVPAPAAGPTRVQLSILDVSGRRVRLLLDGPREPGSYEAAWDGRLEDGRRAASGVYFYRLDLGSGHVETRKLLLLR